MGSHWKPSVCVQKLEPVDIDALRLKQPVKFKAPREHLVREAPLGGGRHQLLAQRLIQDPRFRSCTEYWESFRACKPLAQKTRSANQDINRHVERVPAVDDNRKGL